MLCFLPPAISHSFKPLSGYWKRMMEKKRPMAASMAPFGCRRNVPSKWDDAERWITSPVCVKVDPPSTSLHHKLRMNPKSKSGPLPPPHPPPQQKQECRPGRCGKGENMMITDIEVIQVMSPNSTTTTTVSSPRERSSFSLSSSSAFHSSSDHPPQSELSTKFDTSSTPKLKTKSKFEIEEAKIIAWENLHKDKAVTAIKRLEVKLEKKRSKEMQKIMKKLTSANNKAQEMRNSISGMGVWKHSKHIRHGPTYIIMKYVEKVFHC